MNNISVLSELQKMVCLAYFKNDKDCGSDFKPEWMEDDGKYTEGCKGCQHYEFCKSNSIVKGLLDNMEKDGSGEHK